MIDDEDVPLFWWSPEHGLISDSYAEMPTIIGETWPLPDDAIPLNPAFP